MLNHMETERIYAWGTQWEGVLFGCFGRRHIGRFLVHLVVFFSSTRETHLFPLKGHLWHPVGRGEECIRRLPRSNLALANPGPITMAKVSRGCLLIGAPRVGRTLGGLICPTSGVQGVFERRPLPFSATAFQLKGSLDS